MVRILILKIQVLEILMEIGPTAFALSSLSSHKKQLPPYIIAHLIVNPPFWTLETKKQIFFKLNNELSVHTEQVRK